MTHEATSDHKEDPQVNDGGAKDGPHVIQLSEIGESELPIGTVITGIDSLQGFNLITERLAQIVNDQSGIPDLRVQPINTGDKLKLEQQYARFYGRSSNFRAVITPPNLYPVDLKSRPLIQPENCMSYLAIRDCLPTGITTAKSTNVLTSQVTVYILDSKGIRPTNMRSTSKTLSNTKLASQINCENPDWVNKKGGVIPTVFPLGLPQ